MRGGASPGTGEGRGLRREPVRGGGGAGAGEGRGRRRGRRREPVRGVGGAGAGEGRGRRRGWRRGRRRGRRRGGRPPVVQEGGAHDGGERDRVGSGVVERGARG